MARQREFDEEKVLDALKNIFWEKGFEGTSVSYTHLTLPTIYSV